MAWVSAISDRVDTRAAVADAASGLLARQARPPDLVLAFVSPHHAAAYERLSEWVREEVGETQFLGAPGAGIIGAGRELEGREALSLTAAWLPGVELTARHIPALPGGDTERALAELAGLPEGSGAPQLLLVDPAFGSIERLLRGLDGAFPRAPKVGGVTSGFPGEKPGPLLLGSRVHRGGALVLSMSGPIELTTVVAQGCRPIGESFIITRVVGNVIKDLNAGKPTEVLRKLYESLDARDHALFSDSLFIGIETIDKHGAYESGDFAIRNILGIDREGGAMAVDARPEAYQVIRFHLRDKESAAQDLTARLRVLGTSDAAHRLSGALLFSCLGRGERLYGVPSHDSNAFRKRVGAASLSGVFCSGEIGPIAGRTFLHGYTSVFAAFGPPRRSGA